MNSRESFNLRKKIVFTVLLIFALVTSVFMFLHFSEHDKKESVSSIGITKHPLPANYSRGTLKQLPKYDPASTKFLQEDLRSYDLSGLNLIGREKDLFYADFDSKTKWPKKLPNTFDPNTIMDYGKDPGLNIKELHKRGIDGEGVGIAIIDMSLLVDHAEYRKNIKMYEEINYADNQAQLHGSAVTSIAVGKDIGVAPKADLYYIATSFGTYTSKGFQSDLTWVAESFDRILEVNKTLPKVKKIRVISISSGWTKDMKEYGKVISAVDRAMKDGVFVISSSLEETYGFNFTGLGRNPLKDPNEFKSYEPGLFWQSGAENYINHIGTNLLLVPMDSRTTASPTGVNDYVFYRQAGISWSIPYIAGLYALACQVNPDITPEIFWKKALESGEEITINNSNKEYKLGKIVNPVKLIQEIKNK